MYGAPIAVAVASLLLGQPWNLAALALLLAAVARSSRHHIVALVPDGRSLTVSWGYVPVHRATVEHADLDIRRTGDVIVFRGPGLPEPGLSYARRTAHGLDRTAEALAASGIEVLTADADRPAEAGPGSGSAWTRLARLVGGSAVLRATTTFLAALAALGLLHARNGPSEDGMTSSWAEVLGYSAFLGGATLVLGLIDRFRDRTGAGPGNR